MTSCKEALDVLLRFRFVSDQEDCIALTTLFSEYIGSCHSMACIANNGSFPYTSFHGRLRAQPQCVCFCSGIIDRHPPGVYDRDWGTAEREARHIPKDLDKYFVARTQYLKSNMPAGVPSIRQPLSKQGGLVGENPELCDIPTQRAWMNQEDPGLREYSKY